MECNKDEALRAKKIAEQKMENNDFEGAQKIALKAQNLYPELENIAQLLSICDVQCSAQKKMLGAEKDWYGILQVENFADELTIKKQYRRLALCLHPDKNRFPGAEAAFKLICEANAVLSDPMKKSSYDSKIRVTVRSTSTVRSSSVFPPPHHMNRNAQFNKQFGAHNNVANGLGNRNKKATRSGSSFREEIFWTSCPFCLIRYQYAKDFVNKQLRCHNCLKNFIAYETPLQGAPVGARQVPPSAQHVPSKPSSSQTAGFEEKGVRDPGKFTTGVQNDKGSLGSQAETQRSSSMKPVRLEPVVAAKGVPTGMQAESAVNGCVNGKATDSCIVNPSKGRKESGMKNHKETRETGDLKRKTKTKGRKMVVESSESWDTSSESDLEDVTIGQNTDNSTTQLNSRPPSRSSRKRKYVSYDESDDDDNPTTCLKRTQARKLPDDNENGHTDAFKGADQKHRNQNKQMGTGCAEGSLRYKDADVVEIESDSDQDSYARDGSDRENCELECDEPEFNDFDKDRHESCFAVNQFWACYDSVDGMPRFYAKVKKVCASPFELTITWLEADPMSDAQVKWVQKGLPVGCGRYKLGLSEKTSLRLSFSYQVHCEKGNKRGSLVICPRKGEVWALFKDWDMSWSTKPENQTQFKYEIVEVLTDFNEVAGVKVCYLEKVGGFRSLFQRSSQSGLASFMIGVKELYRFSHRVPYFKMTGSEREGVPLHSLELDPASLPRNPDDLCYPGKAKMKIEDMDPRVNRAPPKSL